jgi:hypothetical protein
LNGGTHSTGNPIAALHPHFSQLAFQLSNVGQSNALRPKVFQQLGNVQESCSHIDRKCQQFRLCRRV